MENIEQTTFRPSVSMLSEAGLRDYYSRSSVLRTLLAYMEASEDWTLDARGSGLDGLLTEELGIRMLDPASPPSVSMRQTAAALSYVRASRILRIHDWLEANPENGIDRLIEDPDTDVIYKRRLLILLGVLARAQVLHTLFGPLRQKQIREILDREDLEDAGS